MAPNTANDMIAAIFCIDTDCLWEGTWEDTEGGSCPECGGEVSYDETEEFSECGYLCLGCGNTEDFFAGQCLKCNDDNLTKKKE